MSTLSPCRVTKDSVFIGGVKLPDYIAANGVTVVPRTHGFNEVSVTFLVGEVTCEDRV